MPKRRRRKDNSSRVENSPGPRAPQENQRALEDGPFGALISLRNKMASQERGAREAKEAAQAAAKSKKKTVQAQTLDSAVAEEALWKMATADVSPLPRDRSISRPTPKPAADWKTAAPVDEDFEVLRALTDLVAGRSEFDLTHTDEFVEGHVKGLPAPTMERLRMGLIPYQDHLDLHGQTLAQAEEAIYDFIVKSVGLNRSCLLLIHGRGHRSPNGVSVIKQNLDTLLLHRRVKMHILAFTTAKPIDGGLGASYILLRPSGPVRKN